MNWLKLILKKLKRLMKMTFPIDKKTGLVDETQVKNVCLHFDGQKYYYTAKINGNLVFIQYTIDLEKLLENSNLPISRFCDIWEMEAPSGTVFLTYENIPKTTIKAQLH